MCGITGIFSFVDVSVSWPEVQLQGMVAAISHRGSDGTGTFRSPGLFLGHARLAILDPTPSGHQPMRSCDNRFVISYNGEIYNFREIKRELEARGHTFFSRSDTEVLLAAWQEWGEAALEKLDGIFAFALYDQRDRVLYLVRDHLGVKPLFYHVKSGTIFFASELLPLFGPLNSCPDIAPHDLDSYFTFNYLPAPRTGLNGVHQLPPGCLLRVDLHGSNLKRYWSPEYRATPFKWGEETVERFRETLLATVKCQTISDVPLGLFLSGGLDSYAVAMAAVAGGTHPQSFTMGFSESGFDETAAAAEYACNLDISNRPILFTLDDEAIVKAFGAMGELMADPSCFPLYELSCAARQEVKVVLAGDGGDELLAGYDTYRAGAVTPLIRCLPAGVRRSIKNCARHIPDDDRRYGRRMIVERMMAAADAGPRRDHASFRRIFGDDLKARLYRSEFREQLIGFDPLDEYVKLMEQVPAHCSYLAARQHADLLFHLPSVLAKVDRMSMACGLEVRVPLLGRKMVELCLNLEDRAKQSLWTGKRILRKVLADTIPRKALKRPKAGFLPPVEEWFRNSGVLATYFGDSMMTARHSLDLLDWDEVEHFWLEHRQGTSNNGFALLGILQYMNWSMQCRRLDLKNESPIEQILPNRTTINAPA
jgi:asparagine synthase (glutamine-hydrolysing)